MKNFVAFFLILTRLASAQLAGEAKILKEKRDAKIAEIQRIYVAELEKVQKNVLKSGNLEQANAIKKEIAGVFVDPFMTLEKLLISRNWLYQVPKGKADIITIKADGRAVAAGSETVIFTRWKVLNNKVLEISYPDGGSCRWIFEDFKNLTVTGKTHAGSARVLRPSQ